MKGIIALLTGLAAVVTAQANNTTSPAIKANQVGFVANGPKKASYTTNSTVAQAWTLVDRDGKISARGKTVPRGVDAATSLNVHIIDFSSFKTRGQGYKLKIGTQDESYPFAIQHSPYRDLHRNAVTYFYHHRSGIAIDGSLVGQQYARPAGHVQVAPNTGDKIVPCQPNNASIRSYGSEWTCDYTLDVTQGWYDAGDHGKYVVNGGISTVQLFMSYERSLHFPNNNGAAFKDGTLPIPEKGDGVPDVLNEARWELEFLLKMQVPQGSAPQSINGQLKDVSGLVHHKMHDNEWTGLPLDPSQDSKIRELHRPSTAAALNLAAAASIGSRLWFPYDKQFAARALNASKIAYAAAKREPTIYAPSTDGAYGGGAYDDADVTDEFYWAATELYLTTGEQRYLDDILANPYHTADFTKAFSFPGGISWGITSALARLQLATVPSKLPNKDKIIKSVIETADAYIKLQQEQSNGFGSLLKNYVWGSNSNFLNNIQVLATASDLTRQSKYRNAALEAFDYIFGRNGLGVSFVVGYGTKTPQNIHSRLYAPSVDPNSPPAPPGCMAGGPNQTPDDPPSDEFLVGCKPALCYIDALQSYSTNELAINWGSALAWASAWLEEQA